MWQYSLENGKIWQYNEAQLGLYPPQVAVEKQKSRSTGLKLT